MICGCSSQTHFCWNISQLCDNLSADGISVPVDQTNKVVYYGEVTYFSFSIGMPKEIMTEIAENTNYTWEQFEEEFKSGEGYHKSHLHILMFWKAFHKLTLKEKKKFLSITNRSVIMYLFKR
ncbi:putative E3 ubiquitin-protein ligase HERC6 [Manis javanica]|nr:putative E3 ubiquitin-protein ligase HERC6 [Manis javanica]